MIPDLIKSLVEGFPRIKFKNTTDPVMAIIMDKFVEREERAIKITKLKSDNNHNTKNHRQPLFLLVEGIKEPLSYIHVYHYHQIYLKFRNFHHL